MRIPQPFISGEAASSWDWKTSVTIVHPSEQGNIIFSSEAVAGEVSAQQYADSQLGVLNSSFPGFTESAAGPAPVFGHDEGGFVRRFSWAPTDGPPLVQTQHYYTAGGRAYVATGTVALGSIEIEPDILESMSQLRIEG